MIYDLWFTCTVLKVNVHLSVWINVFFSSSLEGARDPSADILDIELTYKLVCSKLRSWWTFHWLGVKSWTLTIKFLTLRGVITSNVGATVSFPICSKLFMTKILNWTTCNWRLWPAQISPKWALYTFRRNLISYSNQIMCCQFCKECKWFLLYMKIW